jgi:hypothetical protein
VDVRGQNTRVNRLYYAGLLTPKWGGPKEPILAVCRLCTVPSTKEQATSDVKRLMPNRKSSPGGTMILRYEVEHRS